MGSIVKLSGETLSTLKKLYEIDQSLRIVHNVTETRQDEDGNDQTVTVLRTKSQNRTMMVRVEIAEEFPRDVNIYDLREFISAVNIVTDPVFDFSNGKYVLIKSADDKQVLRYMEANPDLIHSYIERDLDLASDDNIDIEITQEQFKQVITAANTMKLGNVGFFADGNVIEFSAFEKNNGDERDTKKFSMEVGETESEFRMYYTLTNHNIYVLQGEGNLKISINTEKKASRIDTESGKTFWIAMDINSTHTK